MIWVNHCHIMPRGVFNRNDLEDGTAKRFKEIAVRLRIKRAIAFAPFPKQMSDQGDANEWLANVLKEESLFMGFVTLNPTEKDSSESLRYYIEEKRFVGAKLHPEVMRFRINDESAEHGLHYA